jgi:hypothetical protein
LRVGNVDHYVGYSRQQRSSQLAREAGKSRDISSLITNGLIEGGCHRRNQCRGNGARSNVDFLPTAMG